MIFPLLTGMILREGYRGAPNFRALLNVEILYLSLRSVYFYSVSTHKYHRSTLRPGDCLAFRNPLAELQCECQCDPVSGLIFASDIW